MTVRINGEIVPQEAVRVEFLRLVRFYEEHMPRESVKAQMEVLLDKAKEQAIGAKLLLDEAKRLGLSVEDPEVDAAMVKVARQCGGEEALKRILERQQMTREALRESLRSGARVDRLIARITGDLKEPTDDEARKYFQRHPDEFSTAERVHVRHILIRPESPDPEEKAIARAKLRGLRRQIEAGADFAAMAQAHSDCESGKVSGGVLGWIVRGTTLPEFDRAVFALGVGELSDVIETPLGYHIAQMIEREESRTATYEESREGIFDLIRHSRRGHAISQYVSRLKAEADIEDDEMDLSVDEVALDGDESPGGVFPNA